LDAARAIIRKFESTLGDALGLSLVHVNRTNLALRERAGRSRGPSHRIGGVEGLTAAGEFDPSYLHVKAAA
jgi:hypothetical protein